MGENPNGPELPAEEYWRQLQISPAERVGATNGRIGLAIRELQCVLEVMRRGGISYSDVRCVQLEEQLEDARKEIVRLRGEYDALRQIMAAAVKEPDA